MGEILGMFSLVWFSSTKMKGYLKFDGNKNGNRKQAGDWVKVPGGFPEAQGARFKRFAKGQWVSKGSSKML